MKITSSRKDDILKRKAEYEQQLAEYEERQEAAGQAMAEAEEQIVGPIRDFLEQRLSTYSTLHFDVSVGRGRFHVNGVQVNIRCNERDIFEENSALSWNYNVALDKDGNVVKESSSWSGLKATTAEQMKSLRQTVSALEFLNDIDWNSLINVDMPKFYDYYDRDDERPQRPNFEQEMNEAELEDIIGKNKAVKIKNWGESCPYRGNVYVRITKESPSQYQVDMVGAGWNDNASQEDIVDAFSRGSYRSQRVRKSNVVPVQPITIIDLD